MKETSVQALLDRPLNHTEKKYEPRRVYAAGPLRLAPIRPKVSVVGTRMPTARGAKEAQNVSDMLADNDVVVVSGLAAGVDAIAHRTAIERGGRTMAVLGTPLDMAYPAQNRDLQKDIMEKHLAISQFPVGSTVRPGNFVMRNRTMALVSDATIIVEAGNTSGTIHQGWEALRLGRPLYICKTVIDANPKWLGEMMRYGAMPLDESEDVLGMTPQGIRIDINA